jgi:hypothetical protein
MHGDPDILSLGSENGGGKNSVLECCAFGFNFIGNISI